MGSWGAKLEAVGHRLGILPGQANIDHSAARYELQPCGTARSEIFLLRHGDTIYGHKQPGGLLCKWDASEVQVNSSAGPELTVSNVDDNEQGVTETPEEETSGEDKDLDKIVNAVVTTQTKTLQRAQATPKLSAQQSVVVEETPTAARVNDMMAYSHEHEQDLHESSSMNFTPLEDVEHINAAQYSTARTGESQHASDLPAVTIADVVLDDVVSDQAKPDENHVEASRPPSSPRIAIPLKRQSPALLNSESDSDDVVQRPIKRRRGTAAVRKRDDTSDSRPSQALVEAKAEATPSRRRGRQKPVNNQEGADTPQSQRSTTSLQMGTYDGPIPCVALSNSSIMASGQTVKFLKKQGGSLVDSVKGDFNILW